MTAEDKYILCMGHFTPKDKYSLSMGQSLKTNILCYYLLLILLLGFYPHKMHIANY